MIEKYSLAYLPRIEVVHLIFRHGNISIRVRLGRVANAIGDFTPGLGIMN